MNESILGSEPEYNGGGAVASAPQEDEAPELQTDKPKRQASRYFVVFKDAEIEGDLSKAECAKLVEENADNDEIVDVIFGRRVNIKKKQVTSVTLD